MQWRVSLEYPNLRTHETVIEASEDFGPGFEFELYGRRWRVIGPSSGRKGLRMVCTFVETLDRAKSR